MPSPPYIGLRPFEEADHDLFFGREEQIVALIRKLEDRHFVTIIGSSGSGKSSLVRAGLIPALREGFMAGIQDWLTLVIRPGNDPYLRLAGALQARLRGGTPCPGPSGSAGPTLQAPASEVAAFLHKSDRGLLEVLERFAPAGTKTLVVVDQFEELFAFRRASGAQGTFAPRDESAAFVNMLLCSCRGTRQDVWVVLTLRSDFSGDCEAFLGLPEAVSQSQFLVPRLTRRQMRDAILGPSQLSDQEYAPFTVSDGLLNRIINDAGDRPDQLPLMQHALLQTWKLATGTASGSSGVVLDHAHYSQAGGIEQALSKHADDAWKQIATDPKKSVIGCRLFLLLCEMSQDGQIVRRRTSGRELARCTGATMEEITEVVRLFRDDDRNFVITSPEGAITADTIIDVSHEALLRRWDLFSTQWLVQERADAAELRRLTEQAELRNAGVLSEKALVRVEAWRERVSLNWALRYVTAEAWDKAMSYIEASRADVRQAEDQLRRQNKQRQLFFRLFVLILIVATTISTLAAFVAWKEKKTAEDALTTSYVRVIGFNDELSRGEATTLWDLAELDDDNVAVRQDVINSWFGSVDHLHRATQRSAAGLLAATGLNPKMIALARAKASLLIQNTLPAAKPTDLVELEYLVAGFGKELSQDDIKNVIFAVVREADAYSKDATTVSQLTSLLGPILRFMEDRKIAEAQAAHAANIIILAMKPADSAGTTNMIRLAAALAALDQYAQGAIQQTAAILAARLNVSLSDSKRRDELAISDPDKAMAKSLVSLLAADQDTSGQQALAARLSLTIMKSDELQVYFDLRDEINALLRLLTGPPAADVAVQVAKVLSEKSNPMDYTQFFSDGLGELLRHMSEESATELCTGLVSSIIRMPRSSLSEQESFSVHVKLLAKVLPQVPANKREELATGAASAISQVDHGFFISNPEEWRGEEPPFASIVRYANPEMRHRFASIYAEKLASTLAEVMKAQNFSRIEYVSQALARWAPSMDAAPAESLAAGTIDSLLPFTFSDDSALRATRSEILAIYKLAEYVSAKDAKRLALSVADVFSVEKTASDTALSRAVHMESVLARHMGAEDAKVVAVYLLRKADNLRGRQLAAATGAMLEFVKAMPSDTDRARISRDGIHIIVRSIGKSGDANINDLVPLGYPLATLAEGLPSAERVRLLALSLIFMGTQSIPDDARGEEISGWLDSLSATELIEVLKWPVCGGDFRKRVLADLARASHAQGATPWEFATNAANAAEWPQLGQPARQPRVAEVLQSFSAQEVRLSEGAVHAGR